MTLKEIKVNKPKSNFLLQLKHGIKKPLCILNEKMLDDALTEEQKNAIKEIPFLLNKEKVTMFYPGSGIDLLFPILYLNKITDAKDITIIFADQNIESETIISLMMQLTGIHAYKKKQNKIIFKFKTKKITLIIQKENVFAKLPEEILEGYDFYFERAFDLFRSSAPDFIKKAIALLNENGFLITDKKITHKYLKQISTREELKVLGFYDELGIYEKVTK